MKLLVTAIMVLAACSPDDGRPCSNGTAHLEVVRVDEGSTYMKSVYAHVDPDRSGEAREPGAVAAGVTALIDRWSDEVSKAGIELEGAHHIDYYITGHDRDALEKYIATLAPVPSDRKLVLQHLTLSPEQKDRREYWRTYYVISTAIIDQTAIASAKVKTDYVYPSAIVKLTKAGRAAFAAASAKSVGHKLATIVDGVVLTAPIIMSEISGGRFQITMETPTGADELLKRLGCS